jgi:hypothetical protein
LQRTVFYKSLKGNATQGAVLEVINEFFSKKKIKWQQCEAVYTDSTATIIGQLSGLVSWV